MRWTASSATPSPRAPRSRPVASARATRATSTSRPSLTDVPLNAKIMNDEPFGPLAPISPFKDFDGVMKEANRLPWGLAAYAYTTNTQDRGQGRRCLRERHGVDQPPWPRAAGSAVRRHEGSRATAPRAASRRSRPTSTRSSSASSACNPPQRRNRALLRAVGGGLFFAKVVALRNSDDNTPLAF